MIAPYMRIWDGRLNEMFIADAKIRDRIYLIAMGGLAFWTPVIILSVIFGENTSWVWLNVASFSGLIVLGLFSWIRKSPPSRWIWILAGIYILGPVSIILASAFAGGIPPSLSTPGYLIFEIVVCLLPPLTLWMSLNDGMFLSVIAATLVLGLLAAFGRGARSQS